MPPIYRGPLSRNTDKALEHLRATRGRRLKSTVKDGLCGVAGGVIGSAAATIAVRDWRPAGIVVPGMGIGASVLGFRGGQKEVKEAHVGVAASLVSELREGNTELKDFLRGHRFVIVKTRFENRLVGKPSEKGVYTRLDTAKILREAGR